MERTGCWVLQHGHVRCERESVTLGRELVLDLLECELNHIGQCGEPRFADVRLNPQPRTASLAVVHESNRYRKLP